MKRAILKSPSPLAGEAARQGRWGGSVYSPATGTAGETGPRNGFETFAACVAANVALPPVEYTHDGGPLAIWLADTNYPDNIGGEGGHNPEWRLVFLDACPPDAATF